jgi:hypothetical protein
LLAPVIMTKLGWREGNWTPIKLQKTDLRKVFDAYAEKGLDVDVGFPLCDAEADMGFQEGIESEKGSMSPRNGQSRSGMASQILSIVRRNLSLQQRKLRDRIWQGDSVSCDKSSVASERAAYPGAHQSLQVLFDRMHYLQLTTMDGLFSTVLTLATQCINHIEAAFHAFNFHVVFNHTWVANVLASQNWQ